MASILPLETDHLFDRAQLAMEADGWAVVKSSEAKKMDLCLTLLELSKDVSLLQAQYEIDLPIQEATMLGQPEVYFNSQRPPNDHQVACGIEELIAPGDAVVWAKIQFVPLLMRVASLIGTPQLGLFTMETFRFRHLLRRDFPKPGCVSIVNAPLHPDTNEVLEEWGVVKATVALMEPHENPCKTKIMEIKQLRKVPMWAVPRAAPMHFKHQLSCIEDYKKSFAFEKAIENGTYIVVGIRRCSKGPPLLPFESCNAEDVNIKMRWVEAENEGVRVGLAEYLQAFLERLGVNDIAIYDSLHGRHVVRYQAVVQAQDWKRAWAILEAPFRTQRAAYRHTYGGSNAPDLTIDMEPKFLATTELAASIPLVADTNSGKDMPTVRTFIHFSECRKEERMTSGPADTLSQPLLAF